MVAHPMEGLIIYTIVNCRTEEKLTEENAKKRSDEGIIVISAIIVRRSCRSCDSSSFSRIIFAKGGRIDWTDTVGAHVFLGKIDEGGGGKGAANTFSTATNWTLVMVAIVRRGCRWGSVYGLFLDFFLIGRRRQRSANPIRQ